MSGLPSPDVSVSIFTVPTPQEEDRPLPPRQTGGGVCPSEKNRLSLEFCFFFSFSAFALRSAPENLHSPPGSPFHSRIRTPVGFYRNTVSANLIKSGAK